MCSVELLYNGNIGETFRSDPENSLNRGVLGLQNRGGQMMVEISHICMTICTASFTIFLSGTL